MFRHKAALLAGILAVFGPAWDAQAEIPKPGDRLNALPGQPICSNVNDLADYIRAQLGREPEQRGPNSCSEMPTGVDYVVVQVSSDDPDLPIRPARIRVVAPNGAAITGWTVLVANQ